MNLTPWPYGIERPWGWHLRTVTKRRSTVILDEDGQDYPSIRDVFWLRRLGMSDFSPLIRDEQLERMLAVLASRWRGVINYSEARYSLFRYDAEFFRFYIYWMYSIGLLAIPRNSNDPMQAEPSDEGLAVLRMLAATRPLTLAGTPAGPEAIAALGPPDSDYECDRAKFTALEDSVRQLPFVFVREVLFDKPTISLLYRNMQDPIPMTRTLWSMPFFDQPSRDSMFLWLHDRLDRWTVFGELARSRGADALTQEVLALLMLSNPSDRPASDGTPRAITHHP